MRNYLDSLENTAEGKLFIKNKLTQKSFNSNCNPEIVNLMAPEGSVNEVDDMITHFTPELGDCSGTGDGNTGGGSGTGSYTNPNINSDMKMLIPQGLQPCNYAQNSLWQQTFGNRVKCNDYHDGNHRVQTQFWSQNYFLWSDIGTKIKYQKKRTIGWSQSTAADYLELGVNNVHYVYNHNFNQTTPIALSPIQFKYKGLTYDMYGNQMSFPINPNPWPFYNVNQTFFNLDVFVDSNFLPPVNANITFGNVNKGIEAVLKLAKKNLPSLLGLNNDLANNNVGVRIVNNLPNKTEIIVSNKVIGGDFEKIDYNFDFNFLLTFDVLDGFDLTDIFEQFEASKYDVLNVDIYGMARKDGIIKGRRIIGKD